MGQLSGTDVRKLFGISRLTMWRYVRDEKLHPTKLTSKTYLYDEEEVYRLLGKSMPVGTAAVIYARVHGPSQKDELNDQVRRLTDFACKNGLSISKTYWDIGKSLDFSRTGRKGLHELMLDVTRRKIGIVVAESPDRIAHIGHELFGMMLSNYRCRLLFVSQEPVNPRYLVETTKELASVVRGLKKMIDRTRPRDDAPGYGA